MDPQLKTAITTKSKWQRLAFMLLFAIAFKLSELLLCFIVLLQFLWVLFSNAPNQQLLQFSSSLGQYLQQLSDYLSYRSEQKPYPCDTWPQAQQTTLPDQQSGVSAETDDTDQHGA